MHDLPNPDQLLTAVSRFLRDDAGPALGRHGDNALAYQARVAANMVDTVARQTALGPAADAAERRRLQVLLGLPDEADLGALNRRLASRLADGALGTLSVAGSVAAELVRERAQVKPPAELPTAALLRDIGVLVLAEFLDPAHLLLGPYLLGIGRGDPGFGLTDQAQLLGAGGGQVLRRRLIEVQIGLGLEHPGSVLPVIQPGDELAGLDFLVVGHQHLADVAGQLGTDTGHLALQIGVVGALEMAAVQIPVSGKQHAEQGQQQGCQQGDLLVLTHDMGFS